MLGEYRAEVLTVDKKDRGSIFSLYGHVQAWLIRDLLYELKCLQKMLPLRTEKKNITNSSSGQTSNLNSFLDFTYFSRIFPKNIVV